MYALAWQQLEDRKCPGCGGDRAETMDPANEDRYSGYLATCFKCLATKQPLDEYSKQTGSTAGVYGYSTLDECVTTT